VSPTRRGSPRCLRTGAGCSPSAGSRRSTPRYDLGRLLDAAAPLALEADPYLTTSLWAAAFSAEKALRHGNAAGQRRGVRIALEQFRHALRDIIDNRPYQDDASVRDVLTRTADTLAAPQKALGELFGVSVRQLQRWLATAGSQPAAAEAARIRVVAQIVNQLRHTFTGPGVLAWFSREHPLLGERPIALLDDPMRYPELISVATAARSMAG
jgi:uncharacterized protein (DUF2384 family)